MSWLGPFTFGFIAGGICGFTIFAILNVSKRADEQPKLTLMPMNSTISMKVEPATYPCRTCHKTYPNKVERTRHEFGEHKDYNIGGPDGQV